MDLLQLSKNGATHGEAQLRRRIQELLRESDALPDPELLAFRSIRTINARAVSSQFSWMPSVAPGPWPLTCWNAISCLSSRMRTTLEC